ncbi:hypothetical protein IT072_13835 [Leifsonia sp. ZF2019]|uniref:hypothetical protein n=1 Tax=Leifsonia sp. ZF2019 TaxID=2781978 RepID=UPI001CBC686F|nr:hypothetical protein [Leifsonia sp. ZF2019]UAJ78339.1 hypothetical protein IT072_13835 [Leifsonia sp. ZF2019]
MPKDQRIWMTFPINFWMHPKIRPLSDAAFRVFVEINGYSRMEDLDGRVPVALANVQWRPKALAELLANHPERPSLSIEGDEYVIWNYDEHQETRAAREARQATNTANGKRGGRPRKNPTETQSVTDSVTGSGSEPKPTKNQSQSQESEIDDLTDMTYETQSSPDPNAGTRGLDEVSEIVIQKARNAGVKDIRKLYPILARTVDGPLTASAAVELAQVIADRSQHPVKDVDAYVATACRKSPADVQHWYDTCDLGVA